MQQLRKRLAKLSKFFSWSFENALSLDLRSLALARIATGIVILLDLIFRLEDVLMFYTDQGVLPRQELLTHFDTPLKWSLHLFSGSHELQLLLMLIAAVYAVMLIFGYKTRVATIASWILLVSIQNRNPMILNAGDVTFRLLLFWAMFLPWGEYFSLDSIIKGKKFKRTKYFSVATFAFIAQLAFLYWFSLVYKSGVQWTVEFSSLYYALSLDLFTTRLGYVLYQFEGLMRFLTFAVLKVELIAPIMFFIPYFAGAIRTVGAFAIIGMHIGFALFMELGVFPFIHIAYATGIIGPMFWDEVLPWLQKKLKPLSSKIKLRKISLPALEVWIAKQQKKQKIEGEPKPTSSIQLFTRIFFDLFAGTVIVFIVLWNLSDLPGQRTYIPSNTRWIANIFRVDQQWNMFSPYPLLNDGWFILRVTKNDGSQVDFYRTEKPLTYDKPRLVSGEQFSNQRWRKYMMNLTETSNEYHRPYYMGYKCRQWRDSYPEETGVLMDLIYMQEKSLPAYKTGEVETIVLHSLTC